MLSDFQLYNKAWKATDVLYDWSHPEKDVFDNTGSLILPTDCKALYRLNEGYGDKVYNSAPVLGENLWDGVNGDITNWFPFGTNEVTSDEGAVKITYNDSSSGAHIYMREPYYLTSNLYVGSTYELSLTTKVNQGEVKWKLYDTGGTNYAFDYSSNTDFVTQTIIFKATDTDNHYLFPASMGASEVVWVKDISLRLITLASASTYTDGATAGTTFVDEQRDVPQLGMCSYSEKAVFDGVDDSIRLGSDIPFADNESWTFSTWVNPEISSWEILAGKTGVGTSYLMLHNNNQISFKDSSSVYGYSDYNVFNEGELNHIVVTAGWTGITYYSNGLEVGAGPSTVPTDIVFKDIFAADQKFGKGFTDEVSIFNTTLTLIEVQELYNSGSALDARDHSQSGNLEGYWRNNGTNQWDDLSVHAWTDEGIDEGGITHWVGWEDQIGFMDNTGGKLRLSSTDTGLGNTIKGFKIGDTIITGSSSLKSRIDYYNIGSSIDVEFDVDITNNGGNSTPVMYIQNHSVSTSNFAINDTYLSHTGNRARVQATIDDIEYHSSGSFKSITLSEFKLTYKRSDPNHGTVNGSPSTIILQEGVLFGKDSLGLPMNRVREKGLNLNGSGYAEIADSDSLDLVGTDFTLESWVKIDNYNNFNTIFGKDYTTGYHLSSNINNGYINFWIGGVNSKSTSSIGLNVWKHIVVTKAGSLIKYYIDGSYLTGEDDTNTGIATNNTKELLIGSDYQGLNKDYKLEGLIDEPRIYNRTLTQKEITKNYKAGKSQHKNTTISNWSDDFTDDFI
jgi:hypothetical protein